MYNLQKAKQTLYWLIIAIIVTIALYPIITAAKETDEPQLIINYAQFHQKPEKSVPAVTTGSRTISQPKTQNIPAYSGRYYSKDEVKNLIVKYADLYGIDAATPLCIAEKESGFDQFSANKRSSARGVFQYLKTTWNSTDEGRLGFSVFDADANIKAAVKYMAIHKSTKPWTVHTKCPPLQFL